MKIALSDRDREICARIGPLLREKGQIFVGIDVIEGLAPEPVADRVADGRHPGRSPDQDDAAELIGSRRRVIKGRCADFQRPVDKGRSEPRQRLG